MAITALPYSSSAVTEYAFCYMGQAYGGKGHASSR